MFLTSLIAFAAVLMVLAIAVARGLNDIDDILEIVEPEASEAPRPEISPVP